MSPSLELQQKTGSFAIANLPSFCKQKLAGKNASLRSKLGKQPKVATLRYDKSADLFEQSGEPERCVHSEGDGTERAAYGTE